VRYFALLGAFVLISCAGRPSDDRLTSIVTDEAHFPQSEIFDVSWREHGEGEGWMGGHFEFDVRANAEATRIWRGELADAEDFECRIEASRQLCQSNTSGFEGVIVSETGPTSSTITVWSNT
jgi:hypothetical protein